MKKGNETSFFHSLLTVRVYRRHEMGKEKSISRISCEANDHRIRNTHLFSFCKYELHPSIPCCFQPVNLQAFEEAIRSKIRQPLTFLVADLKLKSKPGSFSSCFLAQDRHYSISLYNTKIYKRKYGSVHARTKPCACETLYSC